MVVSDPIDFDLAPQSDLAVTVHVNDATQSVTGHPGARCNSWLQSGNAVSAADLPTAVKTPHWYYLTGVYDQAARTLDIYVNGVKDNGAFTANSPAVPAALNEVRGDQCPYIASSANQNSLLFGAVDEFRLYERALTAAEVAELYRISQ
jgi:hypothetical protein